MSQRTMPLDSAHSDVSLYRAVDAKHASENASLSAPPSSPSFRLRLLNDPKFLFSAIRSIATVS